MLIGRKEEQKILEDCYQSDHAELVAVYGRRRIGKTYLIEETFQSRFAFKHAGLSPIEKTSNKSFYRQQLRHFYHSLKFYGLENEKQPTNWLDAFYLLTKLLKQKEDGEKQIVFLDELPWLDTPKSNFITAFEAFWNTYASSMNVLIIVCGSAISWMSNCLINNHGGLYGRITKSIHLEAFQAEECRKYLEAKHIIASNYDVVQSYMIFGGIPYYLGKLRSDFSLAQNVNELFFKKSGELRGEFHLLFSSAFNRAEQAEKLVRVLAKRNKGLLRKEIVAAANIDDNGQLSKDLEALIASSIVEKYVPFGSSKKDSYYRLIDPFCKFYLEFVDEQDCLDDDFWLLNCTSAKVNSWRGIAFEAFCERHIFCIKKALGITGVSSVESPLSIRDEKEGGAQIDLLIIRKDNVANLCEMKFYGDEYCLTKQGDLLIRNKTSVLKQHLDKKSAISNVLVTTFGLKKNEYYWTFSKVITLNDFFENE